MDAPDKLTEWEGKRDALMEEQKELYIKVQDMSKLDAVQTDKVLITLEEIKIEINRANGIIKRMKKKINEKQIPKAIKQA